MAVDDDWVFELANTPRLHAKVLTLKMCRNRCLAHAADDTAVDIAKPVARRSAR